MSFKALVRSLRSLSWKEWALVAMVAIIFGHLVPHPWHDAWPVGRLPHGFGSTSNASQSSESSGTLRPMILLTAA